LTLANVLGVPAGTAIGHVFGWRSTFFALIPIGLIAMAGLLFWVPQQESEPVRLKHEFHTLLNPKVLLVLILSTLSSVSLFTVFTYIAPILSAVTHLPSHAIAWVLVLFGVGITIGILAGGRLGDWHQMKTMIGGYILVTLILLFMPLTMPHTFAMGACVLIWGLFHFGASAPLQARIVEKARRAPNLASTLNQGAFNLGNALGASLGGIVLAAGYGYRFLPLVASVIAAVVIGLSFFAVRLDATRISDPDFVPVYEDRFSIH
jgi:MFS transporter, DHA1 family, inner membrane transport protein